MRCVSVSLRESPCVSVCLRGSEACEPRVGQTQRPRVKSGPLQPAGCHGNLVATRVFDAGSVRTTEQ